MKTVQTIANEVLSGQWGSGSSRKTKLTKAGYNYDAVQKEVVRLLETNGSRAAVISNMEAWAQKIAKNNFYHYVYWEELYGKECPICHPHNKKNEGWQCIGFAWAVWHHGGRLPSVCNCGVIDNATGEKILKAKTDAEARKIVRDHCGIAEIEVIRNNGKTIPKAKAKPGDIALLFDGNVYKHTYVIMSNNKIADSTNASKNADDIRADRSFSGRYVSGMKVLIRYTGNGTTLRSLDIVAKEVIDGRWDSGEKRIRFLKKAGYDPDKVQAKVNEILNPPKPYQNLKESDFYNSTVRIGQATSDEKGKTTGGSTGDQTGKEVAMANWSYTAMGSYNTWKYVFRAKNSAARLKIAQATIDACNNKCIGYDTGTNDRKSCFKAAQKVNFDLSKITTNCETTCSELANVCIAAAGLKSYLPVTKNAYVESLKNTLIASDEFYTYKDAKYVAQTSNLLPGDILVSDTHVAMVVKIPNRKSVDEIAQEVIAGKWGSGETRKQKLIIAGYDYDAVQKKVNEILQAKEKAAAEAARKKAEEEAKAKAQLVDKIAKEVIAGKWGSGDDRKKKLTAAGYDYNAIQKRVNEIIASQQAAKKAYSGTFPSLTVKKSNAEVIADTIQWAKWIASDNDFHYGYTSKDKKANAHHNGCYFCKTQRLKKNMVMPEHTYCCNPFVGAAWAHGGCVPKALELCQNTNSWDFNKGHGYDKSKLFDNLGHPAKSKLKPGDVLCRDTHVALYIGNGKIVQAGGGDDNKKYSAKWNKSISVTTLTDTNYKNFKRVHRFNSSVNATMNIRHGEYGKRVAQWQAFLDWYFDGKVGKADGCYGDNTLKWTKKFQEQVIGKGQGDGIIGPKTLEAAKKVKK